MRLSLCSRRKTGEREREWGSGENGNGRREGFFLAFLASPAPFPFTPATQATRGYDITVMT